MNKITPSGSPKVYDWSLRPVGLLTSGEVWQWMDDAEKEIYRLQARIEEQDKTIRAQHQNAQARIAELKIRNEALERLGSDKPFIPSIRIINDRIETAAESLAGELQAHIEYARTKREEQPDG